MLPPFLVGKIPEKTYVRWLKRRAVAHVRRDRARRMEASVADYETRIHAAVVASEGVDAYTGEPLRWDLISTFRNKRIAHLPTVDHFEDGSFRICSWRTNDAKGDMTIAEFRGRERQARESRCA